MGHPYRWAPFTDAPRPQRWVTITSGLLLKMGLPFIWVPPSRKALSQIMCPNHRWTLPHGHPFQMGPHLEVTPFQMGPYHRFDPITDGHPLQMNVLYGSYMSFPSRWALHGWAPFQINRASRLENIIDASFKMGPLPDASTSLLGPSFEMPPSKWVPS